MRLLKALFIVLLFFLDIAIGGLLIAIGLGFLPMESVLAFITDITTYQLSEIGFISAGVILILMRLCILFVRKKRPKDNDKYISFDNSDGQILVSVSAIEDFIKKVCKGFSEVKDIDPKVIASSSGVIIKVRVVLWSGGHVPAFSEDLQRELKTQVQDVLGIENVQKVDLTISEISERKGGTNKKVDEPHVKVESEPEEVVPTIPFRD